MSKKILLAVLDWGLGHASRSSVIAKALIKTGVNLEIAGAGPALALLQKEVPEAKPISLPAYAVRFGKGGAYWQLGKQLPRLIQVANQENQWLKQYAQQASLDGIISDCRFGLFHRQIPSVLISHQVQLPLSGSFSWPAKWVNQKVIQQFQELWIPDLATAGIAGRLSRPKLGLNARYLGPLSRFRDYIPEQQSPSNHILILLSGPEPQRSYLEEKLLAQVRDIPENFLFIRGKFDGPYQERKHGVNTIIINHQHGAQLAKSISEAKMVICRSGYSTLMDLAVIGKKALLIPTPGQDEQIYLAKHWQQQGWALYQKQEDLQLAKGINAVKDLESTLHNRTLSNLSQVIDYWLKQL